MKSIQDVLNGLRSIPGVKGAALVTSDGMIAASALSAGTSEDVAAGLASFLISTTQRSLTEGGIGRFRRFVLHATNGKILLLDMGASFLVVQTDQFARADLNHEEFDHAVELMRRMHQVNAP